MGPKQLPISLCGKFGDSGLEALQAGFRLPKPASAVWGHAMARGEAPNWNPPCAGRGIHGQCGTQPASCTSFMLKKAAFTIDPENFPLSPNGF